MDDHYSGRIASTTTCLSYIGALGRDATMGFHRPWSLTRSVCRYQYVG